MNSAALDLCSVRKTKLLSYIKNTEKSNFVSEPQFQTTWRIFVLRHVLLRLEPIRSATPDTTGHGIRGWVGKWSWWQNLSFTKVVSKEEEEWEKNKPTRGCFSILSYFFNTSSYNPMENAVTALAVSIEAVCVPLTSNTVCMTMTLHVSWRYQMNGRYRLAGVYRLTNTDQTERRVVFYFSFFFLLLLCEHVANLQQPPAQCPSSSGVRPLDRLDISTLCSLISMALWATAELRNHCWDSRWWRLTISS